MGKRRLGMLGKGYELKEGREGGAERISETRQKPRAVSFSSA